MRPETFFQVNTETAETILEILQEKLAFQGREKLNYDTYQLGSTLSHIFSDKFKSYLSVSGVVTSEREYFDCS